jgi:gas vesicle protein
MREMNQGNGAGILMAAVVGAAVGAGVALLLAPQSGRQTRGWLADRGRDLRDRVTNAVEETRDSVLRTAKEIGKDGDSAAKTLRL